MSEFLTITEAAKRYVVSESTLRRRIAKAELESTTETRNGRSVTVVSSLHLDAMWFLRDYQALDAVFASYVNDVQAFDDKYLGETAKQQWVSANDLPQSEQISITVVAGGAKEAAMGAAVGSIVGAAAVAFFDFLKTSLQSNPTQRRQGLVPPSPILGKQPGRTSNGKHVGFIVRLTDKGFGFIDTGTDHIFFHSSSLEGVQFDELIEGQKVAFRIGKSSKGFRAEDVSIDD